MAQRIITLARALVGAGRESGADDRLSEAARRHVETGPLDEALVCLSLSGDARWIAAAPPATRARIDLLIWEAGAGAVSVPELGGWLCGAGTARALLLDQRGRGSLRLRSLAARALGLAADGVPEDLPRAEAEGLTDLVTSLATHPEPVVWIPAVRAFGRLAARVASARFRLLRWRASEVHSERRRAVAALASAPMAAGLGDAELRALLGDQDPWLVAAIGVASPYLMRERRELADSVLAELIARPGAASAWSVTEGLSAARRSVGGAVDPLLSAARARAAAARPRSPVEAQLWQAVRRSTDFLDGLEADAAFPDELLDRVVRDAARIGADKMATRAAAIARGLRARFDALLPTAFAADSTIEDRSHALAAIESCVRAASLALWEPVLVADGREPISADHTTRHMAEVFAGYLEHRNLDFALRRTALRGLGSLADAAGEADARGRAAAFALTAVAGSRWAASAPPPAARKRFRKPVTDLFWRLGDALSHRQAPVGQVAAWWSLCAGAPELLELLEPDEDAERVAHAVDQIQRAPAAATAGASVTVWGPMLERALEELGAGDTVLAAAVRMLCGALADVDTALRGRVQDDLGLALALLVEPVAWLGVLARDPRAALSEGRPAIAPGPDADLLAEANAAISAGEPSPDGVADVVAASWGERVGPVLRPVVERAVRELVRERRRFFEVSARDDRVGPYHKLRRLGSGGHADVWLARRDGARRFVLKIPRRELSPAARAELGAMLEREAKLLEGLHEAKVASFIDHGWAGDTPYLVLEYLVGVDLFHYASVELLTLRELAPIVRDMCLGLRALHSRGIVHRDLKPANVFLRLQLPPEAREEFRAAHRDSNLTPVSDAVLIDFGVAWRMSIDAAREYAEGTLGYLSPEQAEAADEISGKSDVYGLAATVFTALTGRRFFEDRTTQPAYLVAHALERPFADSLVCKAAARLPDPLIALLDRATSIDPDARPDVDEFARQFADVSLRFG